MTKGPIHRFVPLCILLLSCYARLSAITHISPATLQHHELIRDKAISALMNEEAYARVSGLPQEGDAHLFPIVEEKEDNEVDSFKKQLRGSYHFIISFFTAVGLSEQPAVFPFDPTAKADALTGRYLLLRIFRI